MDYIRQIDDPRKPSNGTLHSFEEIMVIALCAMLCEAESFEDMAFWGKTKQAWLRRFLVLENGIPSADTFERVFRIIDPKRFESVFRQWVGSVVTALGGQIAVDGKTLRGSRDGEVPQAHMVSAFVTDLGLVIGQEKVNEKSNEITAIPVLLDALYIKGFLVSSDAMGCQKEIADKIVAKGGDYLLAVKGNQPKLHDRIAAAFMDKSENLISHEHLDPSHGRLVVQISKAMPSQGIIDAADWRNCKTIGQISSLRIVDGKASDLEMRYYISSRQLSAEELAKAAKAHWGIENRLHWMLDVNFSEDACTVRKDNAPQNLSLLRKIVLNLIRCDTTDKAKTSLRQKRKRAAWDDDVRMCMLGLNPL